MPISPNGLTLEANGWVVRWVNLGEGSDGDYNPDDPNDTNYLRFDVYVRGESGNEVCPDFDSSFCTRMPADTHPKLLVVALYRVLFTLVNEDGKDERVRDYKGKMQRLSHICPNDVM